LVTIRCRRWFVPGTTVRLYRRGDVFSRQHPLAEATADADGSVELSYDPDGPDLSGFFEGSAVGFWVEGDQVGRGVRAVAFSPSGSVGVRGAVDDGASGPP
jgi:hypothetical protein